MCMSGEANNVLPSWEQHRDLFRFPYTRPNLVDEDLSIPVRLNFLGPVDPWATRRPTLFQRMVSWHFVGLFHS